MTQITASKFYNSLHDLQSCGYNLNKLFIECDEEYNDILLHDSDVGAVYHYDKWYPFQFKYNLKLDVDLNNSFDTAADAFLTAKKTYT